MNPSTGGTSDLIAPEFILGYVNENKGLVPYARTIYGCRITPNPVIGRTYGTNYVFVASAPGIPHRATPSGNSGPVKLVIRDADCFEQMTGTKPSNPGHALHKTGVIGTD